jgi:hypothetical protein
LQRKDIAGTVKTNEHAGREREGETKEEKRKEEWPCACQGCQSWRFSIVCTVRRTTYRELCVGGQLAQQGALKALFSHSRGSSCGKAAACVKLSSSSTPSSVGKGKETY